MRNSNIPDAQLSSASSAHFCAHSSIVKFPAGSAVAHVFPALEYILNLFCLTRSFSTHTPRDTPPQGTLFAQPTAGKHLDVGSPVLAAQS